MLQLTNGCTSVQFLMIIVERLFIFLQLVHTADTDKTRLSCLVRVGGVNKLLA